MVMMMVYWLMLAIAALAFSSLSHAQVLHGLEGFWRLDDGVGEVASDASGNGRHGKIVRAEWVRSDNADAFALKFDGLFSFVDIAGEPFQFREEVTIAAWINPSDLSSEGAIVSLGREHPSSGYHLIHSGGALNFLVATEKRARVGSGALFRLSTKPVLQLGKWVHVAATYSANRDEAIIYVDGEPAAKSKADGKIAYYAVWGIQYPPITIGDRSHQKPFWSFDGLIRNVRIYSRALSYEEISAIYSDEAQKIEPLMFVQSIRKLSNLTCKLLLEVVDGTTGKATPAKVFITDSEGNGYYPPEAYENGVVYGLLERRKAFYTDGIVTVPLPEGTFTIEVTKGYEFMPKRAKLTVKNGEFRAVRIKLSRIADMTKFFWFSGEHHMHCVGHGVQKYDRIFGDPKKCLTTLKLILKAEGLHFAFMVPHGLKFGETYVEHDFLLHASDECGSGGTGGDICLIGAKIRPKIGNIFENISAFATAHENGWVALHTHPDWGRIDNPKDLGFARDLPIVVAYGLAPVWDLFCWAPSEEKLQWWYRWLNLGFKLGITGSTDTYFNNPRNIISPGRNRTYVHAKSLDLDAIVDAYKNGRTFATTGPLLIFQARLAGQTEWAEVGNVIKLPGLKPQRLEIRLRCFSAKGLGRMELVCNGNVAWVADGNGEIEQEHTINLAVDSTCWLAARCYDIGAKDVRGGFAHTSPIYVQVGDEPMEPKDEDIAFFIRWLKDYERVLPIIAKDIGVSEDKYHGLIEHIRKAKEIYLSLKAKPRRWVE
ncbi:MAG: CehA/McbA family metallohydrolase [Armatimonadota bacterium]|nr:CehA/McbA family metallohydrolase [Armatimonadota bacterium]MDW8026485.1 CehA/McbA family metallohydrolase [Armatimonadota bacterium]